MRIMFRKLGQVGWSFPIILALVGLCVASVFAITSATSSNDALRNAPVSQTYYIIIGFVVFLIAALTPYHLLVRISPILYAIGICLLVACFIPGMSRKVYGAHSWVRLGPIGFEPAEFVKLAYILAMAWFLRVRENQIQSITTFVMALVITAVPFILIKEQPAFGTASVFYPICFAMLFVAGTRVHYLLLLLAPVVFLTIMAYFWVHLWDKPVPFMKPFQLDRIKSFFDPSRDAKNTSYQSVQAMIAIGSGGAYGKGWRQGVETELGFLPKNTSYNDLIFPVVAEDFGFLGAAALIIGEGTVLLWCWWVSVRARDKIGALLAVGVMMMLFTHIFVNVGMTLQLVPITGIPLPFMSYGGTFLVACLAAMGLVQSVWVHRKNFDR